MKLFLNKHMMSDKYPSKYSNGKSVSAAQYITELICERKALKDKLDLHYRFWLEKNWSLFYRNQIASANKLLKKYPSNAIVKALNSDAGKKIYSLRAPHLIDMIDRQVDLLEKNPPKPHKRIETKSSEDVVFKKDFWKKNILSKLKELDNDT